MTLQFADEAAVECIGRGLLDHTLPKSEWTHAAHFAAALWLLRHDPHPPLETRMPALMRAYNEATGVPNTDTDGYHETITRASIGAARAFLATRSTAEPLHEIVDHLMATRLGRSDWLMGYWSRERLFSVEARRRWLEPDLRPFLTGAAG